MNEDMIKVYKIKIGEKVYEVELEAVSEKEGKIVTDPSSSTDEPAKKADSPSRQEIRVEAPMQGLVLNIGVVQGQKVKAGESLVILEAMKMENPIVAPQDGIVQNIAVSKGDTVETGDILIILT